MNEGLLELVLKQSFPIVVMSVFIYVAYKYFTKQQKELMERMDKREEVYMSIIKDKDEQLIECHTRQFEMSKLSQETWMNVMHSINDLRRLIEQKINPLK